MREPSTIIEQKKGGKNTSLQCLKWYKRGNAIQSKYRDLGQVIDFIKCEIMGGKPDVLAANPLLDFENKVNVRTGEMGAFINAFFRGMEFRIYEPTETHPERRITLEGSIHKAWNHGAQNFNDFDLTAINEVLADITRKFGINPQQMLFRQLEIGVNIIPPIKTKEILDNCLLYKRDRLKWVYTPDEGNYIQARQQRAALKIYDKRTHYQKKGFKIDQERLRIEIKYSKMLALKQRGIKTLADLLEYGLDKFTPELVKAWQSVLFYDHTILDGTKYESNYSNINYWLKLSPSNFKHHRTTLNKMLDSRPDSIRTQIKNRILQKCNILTGTSHLTPLNIGVIRTVEARAKKDRVCVVTGLNIGMQNGKSFHLSHTGLKYYMETDKKIFTQIKRKYLSEKWKAEPEQTQIKELAHNIRNTWNNHRNRQKRKTSQGQMNFLSMFN